MPDTYINFKIDVSLQRAFRSAAESNDTTMSQLLRQFVRDYVDKNAQGSLFKGERKA